jgi:hypothetical protein
MAINLIQQTYLDSLLHPLAPRELTTGPLAQVLAGSCVRPLAGDAKAVRESGMRGAAQQPLLL